MTTDTDLMRAVCKHSTMKRLAEIMSAPIETARTWLYRGIPATRRREFVSALNAEIDHEMAALALLKVSIAGLLEEIDRDMAPSLDGQDNKEGSAKARRKITKARATG